MWKELLQVLSSKCVGEVYSRFKDMNKMSYTRKKVRAYVVTTRTRHMFVIIKMNTAIVREPYRILNISLKVGFHKKLSSKAIRRFIYLFTPYAHLLIDCKEGLDYVISEVSGMFFDHLSSGIIQSYAVEV